jgi:ATP-dependent helicase/nuclease subunit A
VLQVIDLTTLASLDVLVEGAARDENMSDATDQIAEYVRHAAASAAVQAALASGRYWRELPVGVVQDDGAILEGAIDLLYEQADGRLVIVDYKTDRILAHEVAVRTESYRAQGEAYAAAVTRVTGREVARVVFVFAALHGLVSELTPARPA